MTAFLTQHEAAVGEREEEIQVEVDTMEEEVEEQ